MGERRRRILSGVGREDKVSKKKECGDLVTFFHFDDRELKCENCVDFTLGACDGKNKTIEEIKACMASQEVNFVYPEGSF